MYPAGTRLFYYDKKGVRFNALLIKFNPAVPGVAASEGKKAVAPEAESVDLVYVPSNGKTVQVESAPRRTTGVEKNCYKLEI